MLCHLIGFPCWVSHPKKKIIVFNHTIDFQSINRHLFIHVRSATVLYTGEDMNKCTVSAKWLNVNEFYQTAAFECSCMFLFVLSLDVMPVPVIHFTPRALLFGIHVKTKGLLWGQCNWRWVVAWVEHCPSSMPRFSPSNPSIYLKVMPLCMCSPSYLGAWSCSVHALTNTDVYNSRTAPTSDHDDVRWTFLFCVCIHKNELNILYTLRFAFGHKFAIIFHLFTWCDSELATSLSYCEMCHCILLVSVHFSLFMFGYLHPLACTKCLLIRYSSV